MNRHRDDRHVRGGRIIPECSPSSILVLNWMDASHPQAGGAEIHLHRVASQWAEQGIKTRLLCSSYAGASKTDFADGMEIIRSGGRYDFNMVAPFLVRQSLKEHDWDLVIEDYNKLPFFSRYYHRKPILVLAHHLFGKSVFLEVGSSPLWKAIGAITYYSEKLAPRFYRGLRVVAVSESTKQNLVSLGWDSGMISVVPNGIDPGFYHPADPVEKFDDPTIIYVGRIKRYKSIEHLLQAGSRVRSAIPDVRLFIIGGGSYLPDLRAFAAEHKMEGFVTFTDFVSEEEKREFLRKAHVAVYPSMKEGWGITNIEANACGTPVIAANVPGLRDSVRDGITGRLYPYGDIEKLTQLLIELLQDRDRNSRLAQGGLEWASRFSWRQTASKILEVAAEVCAKRGRGEGG